MLDQLTIGLILLAALLHATWHSLVKYGADQIVVLSGMSLVAGAAAACALPFLPPPPAAVWPIMALSVLLHVGYKIALARSYVLGDLSQAYPAARGFTPLFATAIAFVLLDQIPSGPQLAGITLISIGLIWLATHSIRGGVNPRLFLVSSTVGLTVAAYSAIDAYGIRLAGDWVSYTGWLIVADSATFLLLVYAMRGRALQHALWRERARILVSGSLGLFAFSVFLWALSRSPVGPVTALRESSVLFATLIGIAIHRESASTNRVASAAVIALGISVVTAFR